MGGEGRGSAARGAQFWRQRGVQIYSDQHVGGGLGPGQQQRLARIPFPRDYSLEVLRNYSAMRLDIEGKGGGLKMYVGEEDCAADKNEANDAFCHAHWRGPGLRTGLAPTSGASLFGFSDMHSSIQRSHIEYNFGARSLEVSPILAAGAG